MGTIVQARLDAETKKVLDQLTVRLGLSPSAVVREGIRLLAVSRPGAGQRRIAGVGKFASGIPDLGSNKKHLDGFGQ